MLKPPKVGGAEQLRLFVHQLGFDRCVKILDIHPSTLRGWLRGARPAPQAALQALYWLTDWGYSVACSEAHWSHQFMIYKVRELEARLAAMRSVSAPVFNHDTGHTRKFFGVVGHHDKVLAHGGGCNHGVPLTDGLAVMG